MPGRVSSKRASTVLSDDDDDDDEVSIAHAVTTAAANKRARLDNRPNHSTDRPSRDRPETIIPSINGNGSTPTEHQAHQPGSIVRVTLKNFVTYTNAEFLPGPSLNMVIGPNGTGKSTLVCAICLGLGWDTKHLGRAKDPGEFIKHGSKEARIEVELAADPHRHDRNPVIKHVIRKSDGATKSAFLINGQQSTKKAVGELCRTFSIQVDNLCQFLPQDRVVEFAALSPVDLLTQTQRAAAPEYLVGWHQKLKDLRVDQEKSQIDRRALTDSLKTLEGRQNSQRADVQRSQERREIQERLGALEMLRPAAAYRGAKQAHEEAKKERQLAQTELNRLESEAGPAREVLGAKEQYLQLLDQRLAQRKRIVERSENNALEHFNKQKSVEDQIKERRSEIEAEQNAVKKQKQDKTRLEAQIADWERIRNQPPPDFDPVSFNEQLREFTRQSRALAGQIDEARSSVNAIAQQVTIKLGRQAQIKRDLESLQSQAGQQTSKLREASRDAFAAWQWVQENPDRISGPVFGPPIVSCSVKDPKNADIVESVLSYAELQAFTVTTKEAYSDLQRILYSEMKLADITIRVIASNASLDNFRAPLPKAGLAALGLDAYLLDLIDGPTEVLAMLCQARGIHQTGVAFSNLTERQADAISQSPIQSYATPIETFTITRRREYGAQGVSTRTQRLKKARFFGSHAVDSQAQRDMQTSLREIEGEIVEAQTQGQMYRKTRAELEEKVKAIDQDRAAVQERKNQEQAALTHYNGIGTKLTAVKERFAKLVEAEKGLQIRVQTITNRVDELTLDRGQATLGFVNAVHTLQRLHTELFECELLHIEAGSTCEHVKEQHSAVCAMLDQRKLDLATLARVVADHRATAQGFMREVKHMMDTRNARQEEIHAAQPPNQSSDELETEIESLAARLEMYHEGDPNVMREFEERAAKIDKTQQKLAKIADELGRYDTQIGELRAKWEPEVDELVAKISHAFSDNFARIGCAGEVRVHKEEDFANWAVQILVKFREKESLSALDSHRQSGGERAVSTIFYLMALQSLARAPFRVVDEINQGMDPRNERLVHSRIVDIACAENTSQYFLITPKLLPNLKYHPKMKVHCIASGEYMPADHKKLDFSTLVKQALLVKQGLTRPSVVQAC